MKKLLLLLLLFAVGCSSAPITIPTDAPTTPSAPCESEEDASIPCEPAVTLDASQYADDQSQWNILILGGDYREGDSQRENTHTDAIIIASISEGESMQVTYLTLPRDLWMGDDYGIANSIYRTFGAEETAAIFGNALGIKMDAVMYLDMDSFVQFVDSIGGVQLTMPRDVHYKCGENNRRYEFAEGQTEVFPGDHLLCLARERKTYGDEGFFVRQSLHPVIVQGIYQKLIESIIYDPEQLAVSAMSHPFVQLWPLTETIRLAKLAIRSTITHIETCVVNIDADNVVSGQEYGELADGTEGFYFVHYASPDGDQADREQMLAWGRSLNECQ